MYGGDAIRFLDHFVQRIAKNYFPAILPGLPRNLSGWKPAEKFFNRGRRIRGELRGVREQDSGTTRAVLRLANQIDRSHFGVARIVGDDQRLGWPREQVEADASEQLALGF